MRETLSIAASCKERFISRRRLAPHLPGCWLAGTSELRDRYDLVRPDPPFGILVATVSGEGVLRGPGSEARLQKGSLLRAPPHIAHAYGLASERWEVAWFHLDPAYSRALAFPAEPQIIHIGELASELWMLLSLVARSRGRMHESTTMAALSSFMPELVGTHRLAADPLHPLEAELLASLHSPWSIVRMARVLHCSPAELHRRCRQSRGTSPKAFLTHLRMARARALLVGTNDGLRQIAAQVGYANEFAFSAAFKRLHGKSPRTLRERP